MFFLFLACLSYCLFDHLKLVSDDLYQDAWFKIEKMEFDCIGYGCPRISKY